MRDLPASIAILAPDQYYKGYTMVVSKTHAVELYELPERQSAQYFQDMVAVAKAIAAAFKPRKMNYEVLGNTVGHLHWHLFPRYEWDPNPKRPDLGDEPSAAPAEPDEYAGHPRGDPPPSCLSRTPLPEPHGPEGQEQPS